MRNALVALGFGLLALFGAAHANASPQDADQQYIALLNRDGIEATSGYTTLISVGHQVCSSRMQGASESAVVSFVYTYSHLGHDGSVELVQDAETAYCPAYLDSGGSSV